ncbi:MAG: hypothetical protein ACJ771_06190 [Chloroflexota bacterium]
MGKTSPDVAIARLRRSAREAGISIRTKRASKSRPERAYDLIETASGRLLYGGVALADIEPTLARIGEDRVHAGLVSRQALTDASTTAEAEAEAEAEAASERVVRRRPLVGPAPLRDSRGAVMASTGNRRWTYLSAALLGLATLVVAMQQPAFQEDDAVLDARATPGDLGTRLASPPGAASLAPASSAPLASGSVTASPVPSPSGSPAAPAPAAPAVAPTDPTAAPLPGAGTPGRQRTTPAPVATSRATERPAAASPAPTRSAPRPTPRPSQPPPTAAPTPTVPPPPEPTDVPPTPVITPPPEPDASDDPGSQRVVPSPHP